MPKLLAVVRDLVAVVADLSETQRATSAALLEVAREQRITNLIVRSQISSAPQEKADLLHQARALMTQPRRRDPHERR